MDSKQPQGLKPGLMPISEFARQELGTTTHNARRLAREGSLPIPVIHVGRRIYVSRAAVAALHGAPAPQPK